MGGVPCEAHAMAATDRPPWFFVALIPAPPWGGVVGWCVSPPPPPKAAPPWIRFVFRLGPRWVPPWGFTENRDNRLLTDTFRRHRIGIRGINE